MDGGLAKDASILLRSLSGHWSDRYIGEILLPQLCRPVGLIDPTLSSLRERLSDPYHCLEAIYSHYAFARRGHDKIELSNIALEALGRTCGPEQIHELLQESSGERLWHHFVEVCEERRHSPQEQLNYGLIAGVLELSQEIYRSDRTGSISKWISEGVISSGRIESAFMRLVDIRGVGPKLASLLLRDFVFVHHLEDQVDFADRIYVQPIDKWIRALAPYVVPELVEEHAPDWVLAGKVAKFTRRAGVSGIRFNMGASFFGAREVRVPEALEARLELICQHPVRA